jgi:CubicO group peptidase (beta-lactamase class C family)
LDVFNRADAKAMDAYLAARYPASKVPAEVYARFARDTGGLELARVDSSDVDRIAGVVKARDNESYLSFAMVLNHMNGDEITTFEMKPIPRPADIPPVTRMSESDAVKALSERLERNAAQGKFSGAILITQGARTVFTGTYGYADRERKALNARDTRFRIGSMNKMFTGVAIMQLAKAGKLRLDAPLGAYLTDYPNKDVAEKVTIRHLLTHTGGTGDVFGPEFVAHRLELRETKDVIALFGTRGLAFTPGDRFAYSNYGFMLLGAVIEKVSGENYYDYVRRHIYTPAKMTRTDSLPENVLVPGRSVGYMRGPDGAPQPNTDTLPYRGMPAGGGYSTVDDLSRFAGALMSHRLLNADDTAAATTGQVAMGFQQYAYGFIDGKTDDGTRYIGHEGGAPGMNGNLRIFPASGYVVSVLANIDPPAADNIAAFVSDRLPLK